MNFIMYDIGFLVIFAIFLAFFLIRGRKNLKREGLLLLYRTQWGVKLIDYVGEKYKKVLGLISYAAIGLGYILMLGVIYFFYTILRIYLFRPDFVRMIKVPPIMPLIPYIDKIVPGLPRFNFTYWIIIIAIIAISHEFAHGIFMKRYGVKIKSTGFGFFPFFLPIFLAAFVEQDEKSFTKAGKFEQMAILSAGTFANVLVAILFFIVMWFFFTSAFIPAGVVFNGYSYDVVDTATIEFVNGVYVENPDYETILGLVVENNLSEINIGEEMYVGIKTISKDGSKMALYHDAPAIKAGLVGAITEINNVKIDSIETLQEELYKYSPGEEISITTKTGEETLHYEIVLEEHITNKGSPWLGLVPNIPNGEGILRKLVIIFSSFKNPTIYYEPKSEFSQFIYDLLWWLVLISVSVALVNMLPVGIFDGGRFFYLTVWSLTGSEKFAKKSFSMVTWFFLFVLFILMFFWVKSFFG